MDDFDIYGDLHVIEQQAKKDNQELLELNKRIADLEEKLLAKEQEKLEVSQKNVILLENISSLLLTAKAELKRKDSIISDLRRQCDNTVFRRGNHQNREVQRSSQSTQTSSARHVNIGVQVAIEPRNTAKTIEDEIVHYKTKYDGGRDRDKYHARGSGRDREKREHEYEKDRHRERDRGYDCDKYRNRERYQDKSRDRERDRYRARSSSNQDNARDRSRDRNCDRQRSKDSCRNRGGQSEDNDLDEKSRFKRLTESRHVAETSHKTKDHTILQNQKSAPQKGTSLVCQAPQRHQAKLVVYSESGCAEEKTTNQKIEPCDVQPTFQTTANEGQIKKNVNTFRGTAQADVQAVESNLQPELTNGVPFLSDNSCKTIFPLHATSKIEITKKCLEKSEPPEGAPVSCASTLDNPPKLSPNDADNQKSLQFEKDHPVAASMERSSDEERNDEEQSLNNDNNFESNPAGSGTLLSQPMTQQIEYQTSQTILPEALERKGCGKKKQENMLIDDSNCINKSIAKVTQNVVESQTIDFLKIPKNDTRCITKSSEEISKFDKVQPPPVGPKDDPGLNPIGGIVHTLNEVSVLPNTLEHENFVSNVRSSNDSNLETSQNKKGKEAIEVKTSNNTCEGKVACIENELQGEIITPSRKDVTPDRNLEADAGTKPTSTSSKKKSSKEQRTKVDNGSTIEAQCEGQIDKIVSEDVFREDEKPRHSEGKLNRVSLKSKANKKKSSQKLKTAINLKSKEFMGTKNSSDAQNRDTSVKAIIKCPSMIEREEGVPMVRSTIQFKTNDQEDVSASLQDQIGSVNTIITNQSTEVPKMLTCLAEKSNAKDGKDLNVNQNDASTPAAKVPKTSSLQTEASNELTTERCSANAKSNKRIINLKGPRTRSKSVYLERVQSDPLSMSIQEFFASFSGIDAGSPSKDAQEVPYETVKDGPKSPKNNDANDVALKQAGGSGRSASKPTGSIRDRLRKIIHTDRNSKSARTLVGTHKRRLSVDSFATAYKKRRTEIDLADKVDVLPTSTLSESYFSPISLPIVSSLDNIRLKAESPSPYQLLSERLTRSGTTLIPMVVVHSPVKSSDDLVPRSLSPVLESTRKVQNLMDQLMETQVKNEVLDNEPKHDHRDSLGGDPLEENNHNYNVPFLPLHLLASSTPLNVKPKSRIRRSASIERTDHNSDTAVRPKHANNESSEHPMPCWSRAASEQSQAKLLTDVVDTATTYSQIQTNRIQSASNGGSVLKAKSRVLKSKRVQSNKSTTPTANDHKWNDNSGNSAISSNGGKKLTTIEKPNLRPSSAEQSVNDGSPAMFDTPCAVKPDERVNDTPGCISLEEDSSKPTHTPVTSRKRARGGTSSKRRKIKVSMEAEIDGNDAILECTANATATDEKQHEIDKKKGTTIINGQSELSSTLIASLVNNTNALDTLVHKKRTSSVEKNLGNAEATSVPSFNNLKSGPNTIATSPVTVQSVRCESKVVESVDCTASPTVPTNQRLCNFSLNLSLANATQGVREISANQKAEAPVQFVREMRIVKEGPKIMRVYIKQKGV